eukprot:TRINITY_DN46438_c0_g1_i1.p1 TRINITY_DN46438_c0_g1~~TRINITY_DN46438_c0_g1_i1.p1  ORF type:complete len:561 (+),score=222.98 TRINITY_DN46438_c0_g1_i1:104-1786(+)
MGEHEENPFRLPPDDQIFSIREQERQKRAEERERVKTLRVWEKTTASQSVRRTRRPDDGTDDVQPGDATMKNNRSARTESVGRDPRREKENVSEFVAKKREMFLVQMSLDVKKAEILKLDERANQKEKALKNSQDMLEQDEKRFNEFLQTNDQKAHTAMKDAEDMTKKKQLKMQKIKGLKSQLSAIQSEIAKHSEQKGECFKYKGFLEKLTPPEWKDQMRVEKAERKKERKRLEVEAKLAMYEKQMQDEISAEERALEERSRSDKPKSRADEAKEAKEREREMEVRRRRIRRRYPQRETVETEVEEVSSGEELPLYFEEPRQLLDIFTALEESNLFLIQNSQDTEQALEELDQKFTEIKRASDAEIGKRKQNISLLERQIAEERARCDELRSMLNHKRGSSEQKELLQEIAENVTEVHAVCGNAAEHDGDVEKMLRAIEAKLEEYLSALDDFEEQGFQAQVADLERRKEKDRREVGKRLRKEQADRKNEKRLKESLLRSQAPIKKKVGKQIMFRSAPLFQARRVVQEDDGYEEAVKEHDVFGIWLTKEGTPNAQPPQKTQ